MATITVQIDTTCAGSGHVSVRTLRDGVVVSRDVLNVSILLAGRDLSSVEAARDRLLQDTRANDLATFKTRVEAKSVVIPDEAPLEGASVASGGR